MLRLHLFPERKHLFELGGIFICTLTLCVFNPLLCSSVVNTLGVTLGVPLVHGYCAKYTIYEREIPVSMMRHDV